MNYEKEIAELEKLLMTRRGLDAVEFSRSFRKSFQLTDIQYALLLGQYYFENTVEDLAEYISEHINLFGTEITLKLMDMVRLDGETDDEYLARVNTDAKVVLLSELFLSETRNETVGVRFGLGKDESPSLSTKELEG